MRYQSIKIDNFRCYKKKAELIFPENNKLFIIHAKNGAGKTSLLYAFRFCLYGRTKKQGKDQYVPIVELINDDNKAKGQWEANIELKFEYEGEDYIVKRKVKNKISKPTSDIDFNTDLTLFIGSEKFTGLQAQEQINNILSEDVSKFFLLDMEEVKSTVDSLGTSSSNNKTKENIEKAIAVSFLRDTTKVLEGLSDKSFEKMNRNKTISKQAQDKIKILDKLQKEKSNFLEKLEKLKEENADIEEKKNKAEDHYFSILPKENVVEKRKEIISNIEILKQQVDDTTTFISNQFKNNWFFPAEKKIISSHTNLTDKLENARVRSREEKEVRKNIKDLEEEINHSVCTRCNQKIESEQIKLLEKQLVTQQRKLKRFEKDPTPSEVDIKPTLQSFTDFVGTGEKKITIDNIGKYYDLLVDIKAAEKALTDVNSELDNIKGIDVDNAKKQWEKYTTSYNSKLEDIESLEVILQENGEEISELKNQINQLTLQGDDSYDKEAIIAGGISTILKKSSDLLIKQTKEKIDRYVKEVFMTLINDPKFYDLVIEEGYHTKLIKKKGAPLADESYGQARIAAISLLSSLAAQSIAKAPAVIDTPMAGLDNTHTQNLYRYFEHLSEQTIIFANDMEFREEDHRSIVEPYLSGEATIESADADEAKFHIGRVAKYLAVD